MHKKSRLIISVFIILNFFALNSSDKDYQSSLIEHVVQSIDNAELGISQLNLDILRLEGMSSNTVRHFLNNICSLENGKYLEIGVWKGSTFISALYGNKSLDAVAIDNWALFSGPKDVFQKNIAKFLSGNSYSFYENDCFNFDLKKIKNKINIYFYDGGHTQEDQRLAFTYYNDILADTFIAIVDDYNWQEVQDGTQLAFKELGYTVLFERYLPSAFNGDLSSWWNGIYVAVVSKPSLSLPHPYNTVTTLLPFDGHGWYFNAAWIEKLMTANKIQQVVEVGSWLGASTRHIASLLPIGGKLYAVDIWETSEEYTEAAPWVEYSQKVSTAYLQFLSNTIHAGLTDKVVPVKLRSLDAVALLKQVNDRFDLIYIDAAHDTVSVRNDLEAYFPFVQNNKGILCGDDWVWESVRIAVLDFAQKYNLTVYVGGNFWFIKELNEYNCLSFENASEDIWAFN